MPQTHYSAHHRRQYVNMVCKLLYFDDLNDLKMVPQNFRGNYVFFQKFKINENQWNKYNSANFVKIQ